MTPFIAILCSLGLATVAVAAELRLTWTDASDNEDYFYVERAEGDGEFASIGSVAANVETYTDRGLPGGTRFRYRVRAFNAYGWSDYSNVAEATTPIDGMPPNAPLNLGTVGQLINMSMRAFVGTGDGILIPGLVVRDGPVKVLIRAVGPTLAFPPYNVGGAIGDPILEIIGGPSNDNWTGDEVAAAAVAVGAFPLPAGSKDAALVVTLEPGVYNLRVTGVGNTVGIVLVEVYKVP